MSPETTEKVSVNMNISTLSSIDLLVDAGYYSNRSDFINQAVRNALLQQQQPLERLIETRSASAKKTADGWFIGVSGLTNAEINQMVENGECLAMTGYGLFCLPGDVDREKLYAVISRIEVRGKVIAPQDVKAHYGLK